MFTGIIQEIGTVRGVAPLGKGRRLRISAARVLQGAEIGDSISVNGVCLTAVALSPDAFEAEAVEETIGKTTLGRLAPGDHVNLEAALRADGKLGGHFVQGHVDFTTRILAISRRQESWMFTFALEPGFEANVIPMGSIGIDGVSLTVAETQRTSFTVSVIPHTFEHTLFRTCRQGDTVNVELDMIGKYVLSYLRGSRSGGGITAAGLAELGY